MFGEHETYAVSVPPKLAFLMSIPTNQALPCEYEAKMAPSESVLNPPLTATVPAGQSATTDSTTLIGTTLEPVAETRR
jgi:hypothetical protein